MRFGAKAMVMLAAVAVPGTACADVLEVGGDGYAWKASGPAAPDATGIVSADGSKMPVALHAQALTEVSDRAGPKTWAKRVAELAAKYDISPSLLEAVVWQESRWNERAVSPVGARGLAQLMPGTARDLGVDPDDPHANLEGGARYLRMQLDAFDGDIERALAAYNAGPGRVIRARGIPNIPETQDYVVKIMSRLSQPVRE